MHACAPYFADGSGEVTEQIAISRKFKDDVVKPILKQHFKRDEFLGRINEIVYFLPFSRAELTKLVQRELQYWAEKVRFLLTELQLISSNRID